MEDPILSALNDEQRKAVLQREGAILILAGAGSGKTRVLTSRIALHVREGVPPERILALTFTRKAADELKRRIRALTGRDAGELVTGTFHSVFAQFLRTWHEYIGFSDHFTIYDEDDSKALLKACIQETLFGPDYKETAKGLSPDQKKERQTLLTLYSYKTVSGRISKAKNNLVSPKQYAEDPAFCGYDDFTGTGKIKDIYRMYMSRCYRADAMDFDDILFYMNVLLAKQPDAAAQLADRFLYILVDEYQDTNYAQYQILRTLSRGHGNICVVGDDSQSIYAFRGARIENILGFKEDFPAVNIFRLETNYRSTPSIVDASNRLIEHNTERLKKTCQANKTSDKPIIFQECRDERSEARIITNTIRKSIEEKGHRPDEFAILYRTNAQSREIETNLRSAGIPCTVYSGTSFYARQEIKDLLAYMRLCVNPRDDAAFTRICNRPARGFSDAILDQLQVRCAETDIPLMQAVLNLETDPRDSGLNARQTAAATAFAKLILNTADHVKDMDAFSAAMCIAQESGILAYYENSDKEDGESDRGQNIKELLGSIQTFVQDHSENAEDPVHGNSLMNYLLDIALLSNADTDADGNRNSVSLMTAHCAKGLEFNTVFIAGCEENLFPLLKENSTDFDLEEERRLFYVSITRARERLVLTYCKQRRHFDRTAYNKPSRFLDEITPEDLPEE